MTLDNYKLTLLTAIFIFFITLPIRGQIKFPSYQPAEPNFRTATQPEAQTQQFYSITSEEGQATIQVEKKQYNPTAVPNASRNNQPNYNTNGLKLSSDKTVKSYGGGTGIVSSSARKNNREQITSNNNGFTFYNSIERQRTEISQNTSQIERQDLANNEANDMQRFPSDPGIMPISSATPFMLICAVFYAFFLKYRK